MRIVGHEIDVAALLVNPEFLAEAPQVCVWTSHLRCEQRVSLVVRVRGIIEPRSAFDFLVEEIIGIVTNIDLESLEPVL